jgi:two-component system response regulator
VEDEEDDVFLMRLAMEKTGIWGAVRVLEDGLQAINYLNGSADSARFPLHLPPALVLLDLALPHVMGMDVLKWIRAQSALKEVIVIILTSSQQTSDIHLACMLGANSYLVKPTKAGELNEMVDLIKRYWLKLNQPSATYSERWPLHP